MSKKNIYNQNRKSANTRYSALQAQQRNAASSINGNESQGFDADYNNAYEQYKIMQWTRCNLVLINSVDTQRIETRQAEDYNTGAFSQINDKYNSWRYHNI